MATPNGRSVPIRRPDALASGLTDASLRRSHRPVFRGVHVERDAAVCPHSHLPFRLIIEYGGRQHAESDEQWLGDIGRDEDLDDERIRRLVIVSRDVYSTPARTLARIVKAMRSVGMPVPPPRDDWRRHFPSRPGDRHRAGQS